MTKDNKFDRRTYLGALGAGMTTGVAGCLGDDDDAGGAGNGDSDVEDPIELLTWNIDFLEESINGWMDDFTAETGYEAEWVDQPPDEFPTYYQSRIQGGDPPHIVDMQGALYTRYANDDVLVPLDDYADDEYLDQFSEGALENSRVDGQLWRIPFYDGMTCTYYHQGLFDEAGIDELPESTDDFLDTAEDVVNNSDAENGLVLLRYEYALWPFFWADDIDVLNDDLTEAAFDTDRTVEILARLRELTDDGVIPDVSWTGRKQEQADHFGIGETGMAHFWMSDLRLIQETSDWADDDTLGVFASPGQAGAYMGHGFSLTEGFSDATNEASMEFIDIIMSEEWMDDFLRETTVTVAHESAQNNLMNDEEFAEENPKLVELYELYEDAVDGSHAQPPVPESIEIWDAIDAEFSSAALGSTDPEDAVESAANEVNRILDR